jgi:hypothetical protein
MNKLIAFTTLLLMLAGSVTGTALAQSYSFRSAGTLDYIDFNERVIVISDKSFPLGASLIVYDHANNLSSTSALRKGTKVGTNVSAAGPAGSTQAIYEIWVLPDSFDLSQVPGIMGSPTPY